MRTLTLIICLAVLTAVSCANARTLLRVVGEGGGRNLLADPGFEEAQSPWTRFGQGFSVDAGMKHAGRSGAACSNPSAIESGAYQEIILDQKSPNPIRASAWSKAENVGSAAAGDYALYLDIQYTDGAWVWGQMFNFSAGTHDWQRGEVVFQPEKPVKKVQVYLLFRNCTGKAWFDDALLEEITASEGNALFEGVVVGASKHVPRRDFDRLGSLETSDGLAIHLTKEWTVANHPGMHVWLDYGGGFFIRDVAAGSGFIQPDIRSAPVRPKDSGGHDFDYRGDALGIALDARAVSHQDHIRFDCTARDTTGRDRAVTIGFALPGPLFRRSGRSPLAIGTSCRWWHSIRSFEECRPGRDYCDAVPVEVGATGRMSRYPFACLDGMCLAIPMDEPCVYRIGYNSDLDWYYIVFDLGFCPEQGVTKQKFSFLIYQAEGMRGAADKYYRIFPEYFKKRVDHEGNWMAFLKVGSVKDWQDFGFAFHEGDNDVEWDAKNGIYSFRYTEPMSYWMPMEKSLPRTPEQVPKMIDGNLKQTADPSRRDWASAVKTSLTYDDYGKPRVWFLDTPWCDGAMFLMNPNPALPKGELPATRASIAWSSRIAEKLYGDKTKPQLAGEYIDSAEMGCSYANTRREHFRYASRPLSFSRLTKKPAILQQLSTYEFVRAMADDVHARGKLMMANAIPGNHGFMAYLFDVMGIETNWLMDGKYSPVPDETMDFRRTLCYQKPYCYIMNTDYDKFDHAMVEKYMQRCMFWGMFPGFFSPDAATRLYFEQPKFYERDRDLFRKYLPVIQKIARAGWEPLPMAWALDANVEIERFGPGNDGVLYYTARNNSTEPTEFVLLLDTKFGRPKCAMKLPEGKALSMKGEREITLNIQPEEVAVVEVHFE